MPTPLESITAALADLPAALDLFTEHLTQQAKGTLPPSIPQPGLPLAARTSSARIICSWHKGATSTNVCNTIVPAQPQGYWLYKGHLSPHGAAARCAVAITNGAFAYADDGPPIIYHGSLPLGGRDLILPDEGLWVPDNTALRVVTAATVDLMFTALMSRLVI